MTNLLFSERAMAHCGSQEVLIVGGVGCELDYLRQFIYLFYTCIILDTKSLS